MLQLVLLRKDILLKDILPIHSNPDTVAHQILKGDTILLNSRLTADNLLLLALLKAIHHHINNLTPHTNRAMDSQHRMAIHRVRLRLVNTHRNKDMEHSLQGLRRYRRSDMSPDRPHKATFAQTRTRCARP